MSFFSDLEKLFDTKEDADVTFIIDKQELHAHQFVLINRSPVLKAMIKGPMAPADQRHEINDPEISYEDFETFVKFLYTDQCKIKPENVEALLHLGNMYDVSLLFETCLCKLPEFFSPATLYKYAELGLLYDNKCLILTTCLEYVPMQAKALPLQFLKQTQMVWISPELALEFVKICPRTNAFTENDVFKKVFDWAKGQCEAQKLEINAENLKLFMAPFEHHLKYESLEMKTLTSTVFEYELIPEKRLLKHFRDHIHEKESNDTPKVVVAAKRKADVADMIFNAPLPLPRRRRAYAAMMFPSDV